MRLPVPQEAGWFGSLFCAEGSEHEYSITLGYEVHDVNQLPIKNSAGLKKVFADMVEMLRTLKLKPPIVISRISPESARAGEIVTVYGHGFRLPGFTAAVVLGGFPGNPMPEPAIEADGTSLTFKIPDSINTVSCQSGRVLIGTSCVPTPADHVDVNDCPQKSNGSSNFCGIPLAPGNYQVAVWAENWGVSSNAVSLVVLPTPLSVEITLFYPNSFVDPGDTITVHGNGFTPTGNVIKIGSSLVENIPSSDGKTISFRAPTPSGESFYYGDEIYQASVSNSNGTSNAIAIGYR